MWQGGTRMGRTKCREVPTLGSPDPGGEPWAQSSNCCWFFGSGRFCLPKRISCKGLQRGLPLPTPAPLLLIHVGQRVPTTAAAAAETLMSCSRRNPGMALTFDAVTPCLGTCEHEHAAGTAAGHTCGTRSPSCQPWVGTCGTWHVPGTWHGVRSAPMGSGLLSASQQGCGIWSGAESLPLGVFLLLQDCHLSLGAVAFLHGSLTGGRA